jgi:beta-1,4-N-acetylglucosaminyltransferase
MKIGIVCSPGGHLSQALTVMDAFAGHTVFLITQDFPHLKGFALPRFSAIYKLGLIGRYSLGLKLSRRHFLWFGIYLTLVANFFALLRIYRKERPDLLFSTGAEVAIPAFLAGKVFGTRLVYMESVTRTKSLSLTARVLMPFLDIVLVQWPMLCRVYRKARFMGRVI